MAIEIVDFPIKNGGSFHSKLLVHQRVSRLMKTILQVPHMLFDSNWPILEASLKTRNQSPSLVGNASILQK